MQQTKLLKAITIEITTLLIQSKSLPMLSHATSNPYNYVTSVKVNQVELNAPVTAHQVQSITLLEWKNQQTICRMYRQL